MYCELPSLQHPKVDVIRECSVFGNMPEHVGYMTDTNEILVWWSATVRHTRLQIQVCHASAAVAFSFGASITSTRPLPRQWPSRAIFHCRRPKNVTMKSRRAQASCRGHGNPQGRNHTLERDHHHGQRRILLAVSGSPCANARKLLLLRFLLLLPFWVFGCQEVLKNHRRSCFVVLGLLLEIRDGDDSCSVECNCVCLSVNKFDSFSLSPSLDMPCTIIGTLHTP